jgi:hypothetical protein
MSFFCLVPVYRLFGRFSAFMRIRKTKNAIHHKNAYGNRNNNPKTPTKPPQKAGRRVRLFFLFRSAAPPKRHIGYTYIALHRISDFAWDFVNRGSLLF